MEWGDWQTWGIEDRCPISAGFVVQIEMNKPCGVELAIYLSRCGDTPKVVNDFTVQYMTEDGDKWGTWDTQIVIRYRIRKPRGMTILEEIVMNPERELEEL